MKWEKDTNRKKVGTTRIKTKFLFLPLRINGEIRWLEKVQIVQKYIYCHNNFFILSLMGIDWGYETYEWENIEFYLNKNIS
jgi:hypothetical protein